MSGASLMQVIWRKSLGFGGDGFLFQHGESFVAAQLQRSWVPILVTKVSTEAVNSVR